MERLSRRNRGSWRPKIQKLCLGVLSVATWCAIAPALVVTRDPKTEESQSAKVASSASGTCGEALIAGQQRFEESRKQWLAESTAARPVPLGHAAEQAELSALKAFDAAGGAECGAQRTALQEAIRKDVLYIFQLQRVIAERQALDNLNRKLINKMTQRGGPLRIQEKLDLLRAEVEAYKASALKLLPSWAKDESVSVDLKSTETERRLGELQFTIEEAAEGQALQKQWQDRRLQDLMSRRAYGMSVSLDPALRVLVRPEGIGNLQVFSQGPLGPPSHPADVNFGIMNDGSIADVYREHPVPPFVAVQPAVNVNLNLR